MPSPVTVALADWTEVYANSKRGRHGVPIRIDRPWMKAPKPTPGGPVSPESRARRKVLAERLGLNN